MKAQRCFFTVLAAGMLLAGLVLPVLAASQTSDQVMLQEQARLMEQIQQDTGMSQDQVEALRAELRNALRAAGEGAPVRAMVRAANADGCQGECLRETLRLMAKTMDQGLTAGESQTMLRKEIRNCVRERAETNISINEMCQRLRSRVEETLQLRLHTGQGSTTGSGKNGGSGGGGSGSGRK